jgi:hypothetical protein
MALRATGCTSQNPRPVRNRWSTICKPLALSAAIAILAYARSAKREVTGDTLRDSSSVATCPACAAMDTSASPPAPATKPPVAPLPPMSAPASPPAAPLPALAASPPSPAVCMPPALACGPLLPAAAPRRAEPAAPASGSEPAVVCRLPTRPGLPPQRPGASDPGCPSRSGKATATTAPQALRHGARFLNPGTDCGLLA